MSYLGVKRNSRSRETGPGWPIFLNSACTFSVWAETLLAAYGGSDLRHAEGLPSPYRKPYQSEDDPPLTSGGPNLSLCSIRMFDDRQ